MGVGAKINAKLRASIAAVQQDANFSRAGPRALQGIQCVRENAVHYLLSRVPVVSWLPAYRPGWIIGDLVAGISVAAVMFPQAVMFSAMAGVPVQVALTSSWLPGILYSIMGTSKDISPGLALMPSIISGGIIETVSKDGVPPTIVAAALSSCVGVWSLIFGLLDLGFLYDSLPLPLVLGFTCGISITAYMGQIPPMFGLVGVSPMLSQLTGQFIAMLPKTNLAAFGLGAVSVAILVAFRYLEKKLGHKSEIIRILTSCRSLLVLVVSTGVGYLVNQDRQDPIWLSVGPVKTEISSAILPRADLFRSLFFPSFTLWIAIATEHTVVAKALGRVKGYTIDPSQELDFIGIANIANSFMGGVPVGGGDMSRAAVNSVSGAKSPLTGIFTAIILSTGIYPANSIVEYIPLPAVAAVIIVAVINAMPPVGDMGKYWKVSFTDWGIFLATFNGTLIMNPEIGISLGAGIVVVYTLLRGILCRPRIKSVADLEHQYGTIDLVDWNKRKEIPQGTYIVDFEPELTFLNAERTRRRVVDVAFTNFLGTRSTTNPNNRVWSDLRDKRIQYLRRKASSNQAGAFNPPLRVLILDISSVHFIDSSAMHALEDIKAELRSYAGSSLEVRFVGVHSEVLTRFKRWGWTLAVPYDEGEANSESEVEPADLRFDHLIHAIHMRPHKDDTINVSELAPLRWETENGSIRELEEWRENERGMAGNMPPVTTRHF